ncbi:MAG TPA: type II secretion system F family protein [Gaiellaceae bacterium]|jgi:tight adherence protein C
MLLAFALITLGLAVYLLGEVATYPARQQMLSVRRASGYGRARMVGAPTAQLKFRERVLVPSVARLASMALRLNPKATVESIATRLNAAGLSSRISPTQFLAAKGALAIAAALFAITVGIVNAPVFGIVFAPLLAGVGFFVPDAALTLRTRGRREGIKAELPDALDLLAVSVEAGLGFDGAVTKLTEYMDGALVEEFAQTLGEIRIGESRHEAMKKMAERVATPEIASFVRSVVQADQLGISLGRILRVQAADSRLRRQAAAEEKAMKAPIKMLFPTVLFIFPAMFLVILGPALLNLSQYLA